MGLAEQTVYGRLVHLGIPTQRHLKERFNNTSRKVVIPSIYTKELAEFFGIMLGDGHISPTQVVVTLGAKEGRYVTHVAGLMKSLFKTEPKILTRNVVQRESKYHDVYFGSVRAVQWLMKEGLVSNKVKSQVDIPTWVFSQTDFMRAFMRGFFDTDGSFYKLRFGFQISLTNHSIPLLRSLQRLLIALGYSPSRISGYHVYLTRRNDVRRFFREIAPNNPKHARRFHEMTRNAQVVP